MDDRMLNAFPTALRDAVLDAAAGLAGTMYPARGSIQDSYANKREPLALFGEAVDIPYRQWQESLRPVAGAIAESVRQAWLTRSEDGYVRQSALRALLADPRPWHVPFVLQLLGEYVVSIGEDVASYVRHHLPNDESMLAAYRAFWTANPDYIALVRARAASYWECYYSPRPSMWTHGDGDPPRIDWHDYPPQVALQDIARLVGA